MQPSSRQQRSGVERAARLGAGLMVSLLAWPAEEDLRRHMAVARQPRLLLVEPDAAPPQMIDPLEDWVRTTWEPADVDARARALLARAPAATGGPPELDDDGLLRVGSAWVTIPPAQVPLVRVLLESFERVVRTDAVSVACIAGGASGHPSAVRTVVTRLSARVRPLGLELVTVRRRGVLLRHRVAPAV